MSASVARLNSVSHFTGQAHCNHAKASEQHLRQLKNLPRPTISSAEFIALCKEALQCLHAPKDINAVFESVLARLYCWLGIDSGLSLLVSDERRVPAYLRALGGVRRVRLVLVNPSSQTATGKRHEK